MDYIKLSSDEIADEIDAIVNGVKEEVFWKLLYGTDNQIFFVNLQFIRTISMQELLDIQQYCLDKMHQHLACGGECPLNHYCIQRDCNEGNCNECLHHIMRSPDPSFHYKCKRITYHYMLRYSNRFASEITHLISLFDLSALNKINIVSIGSGPASELWGFLKAFEL